MRRGAAMPLFFFAIIKNEKEIVKTTKQLTKIINIIH
jgi:hypothetical protein